MRKKLYFITVILAAIILSVSGCHKDKSNGAADTVAGSNQDAGFSGDIFQNPASTPTTGSGTSVTTGTSGSNRAYGSFAGRTNPNRPTWRWEKRMSDFPATFKVVFEGCYTVTVPNNGSRWQSGETVVKQSDGYPGMAALAASSCNSTVAYATY